MPPESLSTMAVMNPGPSTAKNSANWMRLFFQRLARCAGATVIFPSAR